MSAELNYKKSGDYFIPDIEIPEQPEEEVRYYGKKRFEYLQHSDPVGLTKMNLSFQTRPHLIEVQNRAEALEEKLMAEMKAAEGITEELKKKDQLEWVGRVNNLQSRVREIVLNEVVYVE